MKKILIILLLITTCGYSQNNKISYSIYLPIKTEHFNLHSEPYVDGQGGNIGIIISRRINRETDNIIYFTELNTGIVRNSYGKTSILAFTTIGFNIIKLDISSSIGLASGYYGNIDKDAPDFLVKSGIMPYLTLNLTLKEGIKINNKIKLSPMVVISPIFINFGLKTRFY